MPHINISNTYNIDNTYNTVVQWWHELGGLNLLRRGKYRELVVRFGNRLHHCQYVTTQQEN